MYVCMWWDISIYVHKINYWLWHYKWKYINIDYGYGKWIIRLWYWQVLYIKMYVLTIYTCILYIYYQDNEDR